VGGQPSDEVSRDRRGMISVSEAAMASTPRLVFVIIVGTLAYFGLAVLGWGGFAAFFSHTHP
jgi:hypothetical protein